MININGDISNISSFNDVVKAYVVWTGKKSTATKYVDALIAATSASFYGFADIEANRRPQELHHVYDYATGNKLGKRLFRLIPRGAGSNKQLFYTFLRSTKSVPRGTHAGDTRKKAHVFIWKAPFLESGKRPRPIKPRFSRALAFPATQENIASMGKRTAFVIRNGMIFTGGPVHPDPGKQTKGKFRNLWEIYWTTFAQQVSIDTVQKPTEYRLRTKIPNMIRKSVKGPGSSIAKSSSVGRLEKEFDTTADEIVNQAHALYLARIGND